MRKSLLLLAILFSLASCKKEEVGCGTCTGTGQVDCSGSSGCRYWLPIRFDDGHSSNVEVDEYTWIHTLTDDRICF